MPDYPTPPRRRRIGTFFLALIIILTLVIGWHFFTPPLGFALAITTGVWVTIISAIVLLCVAIFLFVLLSGVAALVLGIIAIAWAIIAIILFPILFPVLIPIVVILLFIGFVVKKR